MHCLPRVRALQNAALPVMQLPSELIADILCLAQGELLDRSPSLPGLNGRYEDHIDFSSASLYLMHVCHAWRQVGFACAALWAIIEVTDRDPITPTLHMESLQRSSDLPLTIHITGYSRRQDDTNEVMKAFAHLARVRELVIRSPLLYSEIDILLAHPPPQLETFAMDCKGSNQEALPPILMNAPSLRHLALNRVTNFASMSGLQNLTQLQLGMPTLAHDEWDLFLDMLERNRSLRDIMLSVALEHDIHSFRRVYLPKLRRLAFRDTIVREAEYFLSCFDIPGPLALSIEGEIQHTLGGTRPPS